MIESPGKFFASYREYMQQARADLECRRGPLPPAEQEAFGVKFLDPGAFAEFWDRVCRNAALRDRWLRRFEHGFSGEKARISRLIDELFGSTGSIPRNAAA